MHTDYVSPLSRRTLSRSQYRYMYYKQCIYMTLMIIQSGELCSIDWSAFSPRKVESLPLRWKRLCAVPAAFHPTHVTAICNQLGLIIQFTINKLADIITIVHYGTGCNRSWSKRRGSLVLTFTR